MSGINRKPLVALMALAGLAMVLTPAAANEKHLEMLLDGVREIARPGVPASICAFGENAFAIVQDAQKNGVRQAVVAATI